MIAQIREIQGNLRIHGHQSEVPSSQVFGNAVKSGFEGGLGNKLFRASVTAFKNWNDDELLDKDDLNNEYGVDGLVFDKPMSRAAADYIKRKHLERQPQEYILNKAINESASNYVPLIAGTFLGNIADIGELSLGIASGGLAVTRYGAKIGLGINNVVGRTAFRGAAFGMGEAIVSEPIHQGLSSYLKEKYTWQDSLINVAFATSIGGSMGYAFGKLGTPEDLEMISPDTFEKMVIDNLEGISTFKKQNKVLEILVEEDSVIRRANQERIDSFIDQRVNEATENKGAELTPEEKQSVSMRAEFDAITEYKEKTKQDLVKYRQVKSPDKIKADEPTSFDNPESPEYANAINEAYGNSLAELKGTKIESDKPDVIKPKKEKIEESEPEIDKVEIFEAAKQITNKLFPSTKIEAVNADMSNMPKGETALFKGAYDRETGKIFINPEFISDTKDVAVTILHETVGHKGFEANFSSKAKLDNFRRYIGSSHKKEIKSIKDEINKGLPKSKKIKNDEAIDELIARVAENKVQSPRLMETLLAEAKFKLGIDPKTMNSADDVLIRDALTNGYFKLRRGDVAQSVLRGGVRLKGLSEDEAKKASNVLNKAKQKRKSAIAEEAFKKIIGDDGELPEGFKPTQEYTISGKTYKVDVNAEIDAKINTAVFDRLFNQFSDLSDDIGSRIGRMLESYIPAQVNQLSSLYKGKFITQLRKNNLDDYFSDKENVKLLYKAIYEEDSSSEAKLVADILQSSSHPAIRRMNRAGGKTRILKDHVIPRFYSKNKLAKAAGHTDRMGNAIASKEAKEGTRDLFVNWMMGRNSVKEVKGKLEISDNGIGQIRINPSRTFNEQDLSDADMEVYFRDVFDSIWEGKELDSQGGSGSSSLSTQSGAERKIHFKDAETAFQFDQMFGASDTASAINDMLEKFARNTVLMENFGTNPKNMIQRHLIPELGKVANKLDMDTAADSLKKFGKTVDPAFSLVDPNYRSTDYPNATKISWMTRQITNMATLGGLLFTSSSDTANVAGRLNLFTLDKEYINNFFGVISPKSKQDKIMLENNLAYLESMVSTINSRVDPQNPGVSSKMSRLAHKFFDVTGMNLWNRWMRETFLVGFHKAMGNNSQYSVKELREMKGIGDFIADEINASGITDTEWDLIRLSARKVDENGEKLIPTDFKDTYLTRDMVEGIDFEVARKALSKDGKNANDIAVQKYIDELTSKYDGFVKRNMDAGVITPGVRQWRWMNMNQIEGSAPSILGKLLFQFKSFPLTMHQEILMPSIRYSTKGNYAPMVTLMSTIAMGTGIQMIAMNAREVLSGRTARDWEDPQFWFEAFIKAGGAGIVADLFKDYSEYNTDIMSILGGPSLDMASDMLGLGVQGIKSSTMENETHEDFVSNLAKVAKRMTPLGNAPGLSILRDGLYNMTMQQFSPESLDRAGQYYRERGQKNILKENVTFKDIIGIE